MKKPPCTRFFHLSAMLLLLALSFFPEDWALSQETSPPGTPSLPAEDALLPNGRKVFLPFVVLSEAPRYPSDGPYPASPVIESVSWDYASLSRAAGGSDLWPLTWADDGELYGAWGDGMGFSETGEKQYIGVTRLSGDPTNYSGTDLWSGFGKANGIIAVDGVLYMMLTEQDAWMRGKMGYSTDHGKSWTFDSDWTFAESSGVFAATAFLQFGQDYQGARDNYVYGYNERVREVIQPDIVMFRVLKDKFLDRSAYEYFDGLDGSGNPRWSTDIRQMQPVFSDPNGVDWGMQVVYNPVLKRYLLTVRHDRPSGWGIFDAPEPWGPWTTVAYYDQWIDDIPKIMFSFNQKWMSEDGRTMWMVFSGLDEYDSFNVVKATFNLR